MPTISIKPGQLGATIRKGAVANQKAVQQGVAVAAQRTVAHLKRISPVYDGLFKNAWKVITSGRLGAFITNDAPYAGVIEAGARPHGVSAEGREAIREWVRKKVTLINVYKGPGKGKQGPVHKRTRSLTRNEADGEFAPWVDEITNAIIHKLATKGQKGLWLVRDNLPLFYRWVREAINEQLIKANTGRF